METIISPFHLINNRPIKIDWVQTKKRPGRERERERAARRAWGRRETPGAGVLSLITRTWCGRISNTTSVSAGRNPRARSPLPDDSSGIFNGVLSSTLSNLIIYKVAGCVACNRGKWSAFIANYTYAGFELVNQAVHGCNKWHSAAHMRRPTT